MSNRVQVPIKLAVSLGTTPRQTHVPEDSHSRLSSISSWACSSLVHKAVLENRMTRGSAWMSNNAAASRSTRGLSKSLGV